MKYTITTYDKNGNEIVSRNYRSLPGTQSIETLGENVASILQDSHTYLEEQALDYKEELTEE